MRSQKSLYVFQWAPNLGTLLYLQWPVTMFPDEGVLKPYSQQEVTFVFKPVDKEKPPAFRHPFIARPGTAASVVQTASVTFDPSVSTSSAASGSTGLWLFDWLFSYNRGLIILLIYIPLKIACTKNWRCCKRGTQAI